MDAARNLQIQYILVVCLFKAMYAIVLRHHNRRLGLKNLELCSACNLRQLCNDTNFLFSEQEVLT